MAWPYDAIYKTFAALNIVASTFLNALQNRIVDCHRRRDAIHLNFITAGTAGAADWEGDTALGFVTAKCVGSLTSLWIPISHLWASSTNGARIYAVKIKVYEGGAAAISGLLNTQDINVSVAGGAPAFATVTGATGSSGGVGSVYDVITLTPTSSPYQVAAETAVFVQVQPATVNDVVVGVEVDYEPLTAT